MKDPQTSQSTATSSHSFSLLRTNITISTSCIFTIFTVMSHGITVRTGENSTLHPRTILLAFWTKSATVSIKLWPSIITSGLIAFRLFAFRWACLACSASAIFRILLHLRMCITIGNGTFHFWTIFWLCPYACRTPFASIVVRQYFVFNIFGACGWSTSYNWTPWRRKPIVSQ